ncbi:MAG: acyl carrier protein [Pirellulales bacterium]
MNRTLYRLTKIFRETLGVDDLVIGPETSPADVEAWDSVAHVQLFLALETEFDVSLTPDELASIASVGDILKLLSQRGVAED